MINNNDNSLYYEVFNRNLIKYSLAIMGIHNKFQIFNGIVQKKYLMDQIRLQTENIWWMNEFFELIFNENYKEDILEIIYHKYKNSYDADKSVDSYSRKELIYSFILQNISI